MTTQAKASDHKLAPLLFSFIKGGDNEGKALGVYRYRDQRRRRNLGVKSKKRGVSARRWL